MGNDFPNRAAANWGPLQTPNSNQASQNALNSVDSKQRPLVKAVAQLVNAAAQDLYGSSEDRKYRYIVDLILDRVRGALEKQLSGFSDDQLEAISKQNEALLKTVSEATSGIVESAFSKLQVTVSKKQTEELLDTLQDKLDAAASDIKSKLQSVASSSTSKKKSGGDEDVATKSDQLETTKTLEELKRQLAKQFSADKSSNGGSSTSVKKTGKSAFKAASALVISKQLSNLAKNQKIINQSMTKRFEKTTKTISGSVDSLHSTTSTSFYNLNDKLEDSMAKLGRQSKRMTGAIVAGVVGAVSLVTVGLKKTFGAIFGGLKSISGKLVGLFKKPASIIGGFLKSFIMTPGGMFAIGWIAGYVWKRWLKPLWDWMKPIRDTIGEWFGGKITFKDMVGKIWDHISGGIQSIIARVSSWLEKNWETISETASSIWNWVKNFGSKIWDFISPHLASLWAWLEKKTSEFLVPIILDGLKKVWNWFLDFKFGSVLGVDITGKRIMILLATYLLTNMALKTYNLVKGLGTMIKGLGKGIGAISRGIKGFGKGIASLGGKIGNFLGFGSKAKDAAKLAAEAKKAAELAQKASKAKNAAEALKQSKRAAEAAKKARDIAAAAKKTKDAVKIAKTAQQATLAAGRATRAVNIATKAATSAASATGKVAAATAGKTALKTAGKLAGGALVAVDVGMDVWDAGKAFKEGDIGKGITKSGFATAKAASLAAGPLAPVAYGAIMAAEALNSKIEASTAEIEAIADDLNKKTEKDFKGKVLAAIKKQSEKNPLDRLLDKYKNFDEIKAKADPLTAKIKELEKQHEKLSSGWRAGFNGDKIRKLANQIEDLRNQRGEMLAKAGLDLNELRRGKERLLDSRSASGILKQMSPEMQERFKQLMAENTKIGPANTKILPDGQKILEQMKVEFGGQTEKVEGKVDVVKTRVDRVIELLEAQAAQEKENRHPEMKVWKPQPLVLTVPIDNGITTESQVMMEK